MPDFDNGFRGGLDFQPSTIVELQAISVGHRDRFRKVKKYIFASIRCQANAAAMARPKI
jgi:hypothetical protein